MNLEAIHINYSWRVQIYPWAMLAFLIWMTIKFIGAYGMSYPVLLILGVLLLWSITNIARSSRWFEINAETVTVVGWFGRRQMEWNEINHIEYWQSRNVITGIDFFSKNDKKLVVKGPSNWWDIDGGQVLEFLNRQAMQHQVKVYLQKSSMAVF